MLKDKILKFKLQASECMYTSIITLPLPNLIYLTSYTYQQLRVPSHLQRGVRMEPNLTSTLSAFFDILKVGNLLVDIVACIGANKFPSRICTIINIDIFSAQSRFSF
jgi:hypothetical protein